MGDGLLAGVEDSVCGLPWRVGGNDGAGSGSHVWQFRLVDNDVFQNFCRVLCVVRIEDPAIFGMDEFWVTAVVD